MALEQKVPGLAETGKEHDMGVVGVAVFSEQPQMLVKFYEQVLKRPFTHRTHDDGRQHWIMNLGGVQLEIKALRTASGEATPDAVGDEHAGTSRSEFSIQVHGVASAAARGLVHGGRVHQKATEYDWGIYAVLLDPDGNRLGLYEPLKEGQA